MSLLRHGFTSLRRAPLLAITIVLTLGVALAAAVFVFSFLNSYLLRPLPYGDPDRIVVLYEHSLKVGRDNSTRVTYGNFTDILERSRSFSRLALLRNDAVTVHGGNATEVAFVQRATEHMFPLIGARPALGQILSPSTMQIGGIRSVLLSDALWRRRFGADPALVGRTIQLDQENCHVVGVMPADFRIPSGDDNPQAWIALLPSDIVRTERTQRRHHVWGELAPGRSAAGVDAELEGIAATLRTAYAATNGDRSFHVLPLREDLLGNFGRILLLLQGAVLLVLVVASFNCLCLLIARALQRRREFAIRLALGAARRHLLAQLLAESLWLSLPAAALALGLAAVVLPYGAALIPAASTLTALAPPEVDGNVAAAVAATAILFAFAFSCVPLLQTRRLNLDTVLREGGRSSAAPGAARAARMLVAAQIAVALALLICAALLLRSQLNLARVDPGFPLGEFDQFRVGVRGDTYRDPARRLQFFETIAANVRALPGVRDVGAVSFLFTTPPLGYSGFVQEGDGLQLSDTPKRALQSFVLPRFFPTLGLRLIEGRLLQDTDDPKHPAVGVISASLAAKYWPGQSALGRRVRVAGSHPGWVEIVGVVADVIGPGNQPRRVDVFYLPIAQFQPPGLGMGFLVRHDGTGPDARSLQRAVWQADPDMSFFAHQSPAEIYARAAWVSRLVTFLVAAFALLAVALALGGIFAVNSFLVARRTSEFGIRAALGATEHNLLSLVLGESLRLTTLGLLAGAVLAYAASQGLTALLYDVSGLDPLVYTASAIVMLAAGAAAAAFPARRAAKTDPVTALRTE